MIGTSALAPFISGRLDEILMPAGIHAAFLVNGALALCEVAAAVLFVNGPINAERLRDLRHHHRDQG